VCVWQKEISVYGPRLSHLKVGESMLYVRPVSRRIGDPLSQARPTFPEGMTMRCLLPILISSSVESLKP